MKKNIAIFCVAAGDLFHSIFEMSYPSISAYAARVGAELVVLRDHPDPTWARFGIYDLLKQFDRVLYVDVDILVRPDSPDLFEIVPGSHLGACITSENTNHHDCDIISLQQVNGHVGWTRGYFNAGVLLVSAEHRDLFHTPITTRSCRYADQDVLNYRAQAMQVPIFDIGYTFNHTTVPRGRENMDSYFTHFCGMRNAEKRLIMKQCAQKISTL